MYVLVVQPPIVEFKNGTGLQQFVLHTVPSHWISINRVLMISVLRATKGGRGSFMEFYALHESLNEQVVQWFQWELYKSFAGEHEMVAGLCSAASTYASAVFSLTAFAPKNNPIFDMPSIWSSLSFHLKDSQLRFHPASTPLTQWGIHIPKQLTAARFKDLFCS